MATGQGETLWCLSSFYEEGVGSGPVRAWGGGAQVAYDLSCHGHALWEEEGGGCCHGGHGYRGIRDSHILVHPDTGTLRHEGAGEPGLLVVVNDVAGDEPSRAGQESGVAMAGNTLAGKLAIGMTSGGKQLGGVCYCGSVKDPC